MPAYFHRDISKISKTNYLKNNYYLPPSFKLFIRNSFSISNNILGSKKACIPSPQSNLNTSHNHPGVLVSSCCLHYHCLHFCGLSTMYFADCFLCLVPPKAPCARHPSEHIHLDKYTKGLSFFMEKPTEICKTQTPYQQ